MGRACRSCWLPSAAVAVSAAWMMDLIPAADTNPVGLNLTMASKVIMLDPWWNSASEQQAFCRVFRIGQESETFMSRICVKRTVDEKLIKMQKRKDDEIKSVMEHDGKKVPRYVMCRHALSAKGN